MKDEDIDRALGKIRAEHRRRSASSPLTSREKLIEVARSVTSENDAEADQVRHGQRRGFFKFALPLAAAALLVLFLGLYLSAPGKLVLLYVAKSSERSSDTVTLPANLQIDFKDGALKIFEDDATLSGNMNVIREGNSEDGKAYPVSLQGMDGDGRKGIFRGTVTFGFPSSGFRNHRPTSARFVGSFEIVGVTTIDGIDRTYLLSDTKH